MDSCPCQCNNYCLTHCRSIGLDTICDESCGCIRHEGNRVHKDKEAKDERLEDDKHEDDEHHDSKHQKEVDEYQEEIQQLHHSSSSIETEEDDQAEAHHEALKDDIDEQNNEEHNVSEPVSVEETTGKDVEKTHEDLKDSTNLIKDVSMAVASKSVDDIEFKNLIDESMEESHSCDPDCWRSCLQMREEKDEVFKCIKKWGCGYESPQLLLLKKDMVEAVAPESHFGLLFLFFFLMLACLGAVGYYVYKREFDHKLHEDLIYGQDNEGGYEKLD